jgi:hypothetical protein
VDKTEKNKGKEREKKEERRRNKLRLGGKCPIQKAFKASTLV